MNQAPLQNPYIDPLLQSGDDEEGLDLLRYWAIVRKHLFGIIGLAIAVGILALLVANSMTPIYSATTRISIEHVTPTTGGESAVSWYAMQSYPGTQHEIIKSSAVAEKVVENLKLWEHPWFNKPKEENPSTWQKVKGYFRPAPPEPEPQDEVKQLEAKKKALVGMVRGGIEVKPVRDTFIVGISFSSPNPEVAALVVNGVVDAFIAQKLESRFNEVKKVSDWMNESLGGITGQLEESENRLQEFRRRENIVAVDETGATGLLKQRLDELSNELTRERIRFNELQVLKRQADRFKAMTIDELLSNPSIYKHPTLSDIKTSEIQASRRVEELGKRYGPKHPKMQQAVTELESIKARYREQIPSIVRGIDEDFEVSRQKLAALERQYDTVKQEVQAVSVKSFELERLQRDVESNRNLYDIFMEQSKQTNLSSSFETDRVRVIDAATVPGAPTKPNKKRIVMVSMILALMAGIGLAFLIDLLDRTVRTSEEVERKLGLATLGMLPLLNRRKVDKGEIKPERVYVDDPSSNYGETIRTIRTGITLSAIDNPHKLILFTSSVPGEGKTTAACNTALALADLEKTLIFDADMRRPSTKKIFGHDHQSPGMSELLTGQVDFRDVIHKVEDTNLYVITAGRIPPDPLDLLASKKFRHLLDEMGKRFDRIVIDSPPVSLVSDAVLLSSYADAVIYVIKADDTNTKLIESSLKKLRHSSAHIIGAILNGVDIKKMSKYYGHGYGKYYGSGYYSYGEEYRKA